MKNNAAADVKSCGPGPNQFPVGYLATCGGIVAFQITELHVIPSHLAFSHRRSAMFIFWLIPNQTPQKLEVPIFYILKRQIGISLEHGNLSSEHM